jgi:hypothetical protein
MTVSYHYIIKVVVAKLHAFLISTSDEEWSASHFSHFICGKSAASTNLVR